MHFALPKAANNMCIQNLLKVFQGQRLKEAQEIYKELENGKEI
jgi:hypothetical protein